MEGVSCGLDCVKRGAAVRVGLRMRDESAWMSELTADWSHVLSPFSCSAVFSSLTLSVWAALLLLCLSVGFASSDPLATRLNGPPPV